MRGQPISGVRFVAVSATIPNVRDLAQWLGAPPSGTRSFGEEMRPVKLRTVVRGYNPTKTGERGRAQRTLVAPCRSSDRPRSHVPCVASPNPVCRFLV